MVGMNVIFDEGTQRSGVVWCGGGEGVALEKSGV